MSDKIPTIPPLGTLLTMAKEDCLTLYHKNSFFVHSIIARTYLKHGVRKVPTSAVLCRNESLHGYGITMLGNVVVDLGNGYFIPVIPKGETRFTSSDLFASITEAYDHRLVLTNEHLIGVTVEEKLVHEMDTVAAMNKKPTIKERLAMTLKDLFETSPSTREEMYESHDKSFRIRTLVHVAIGDGVTTGFENKILVWGDKTFGIDNCGGIFVAFNGNFTDINSIEKAYDGVETDKLHKVVCDVVESGIRITIPQLVDMAKKYMVKKKPKKRKYRVWIEQVNQCYIDVVAKDEDQASDKAAAKWRKDEATPQVSSVKELEDND